MFGRNGGALFTIVCLPENDGTFPTFIYRNPYVDHEEYLSEDEICERKFKKFSYWLDAGCFFICISVLCFSHQPKRIVFGTDRCGDRGKHGGFGTVLY